MRYPYCDRTILYIACGGVLKNHLEEMVKYTGYLWVIFTTACE